MAPISRPRRRFLAIVLGGMALVHVIGGPLPAAVLFRDDFNGGYSGEWSILRYDASYITTQPTALALRANSLDLWQSSNGAKNVFLIDNPTTGDFIATIRVNSFVPSALVNAPQLYSFDIR